MTAPTRRDAPSTGLRDDLRDALTIALVEVRRSLRAVLSSRRQLLGFGFVLVAFSPALVLLVTGAVAAGARFSAGADAPVVTLARAQVVAWVGSTTVLFGLRAVERSGTVDHADLLLTTVRPRALATGLVLAEYLRILAVFLPPLALVVGAFAAGAGTPALVPAVLLGMLPLLALALLAGFTVGYLLRLGYRRVAGNRVSGTGLGVVVAVTVGFWLHTLVPQNPFRLVRSLEPLSVVPLGPYADLLLLASPFAVSLGVESAVAVALLVGTGGLLLATTWQLAPRVWYADPLVTGDDAARERRLGTGGVPSALADRPTLRLVWWQWLRGVRAPSQFVHLTYFLFMSFPVVQLAVSNPRSPLLPIVVGALGALLAGGTFGLNPAGMEGSMLPTVVTSPTPVRALVHSRLLAGLLLWVPPLLLAVAGLGWYGRLGPAETLLLAGVVPLLASFSCTFALAAGLFAPRFETVAAFGDIEAPTPTTVALLGHTLGVVFVAALGLLLTFGPRLVDAEAALGVDGVVVQLAGFGVWAVCVVPLTYACYRYARGRAATFVYE